MQRRSPVLGAIDALPQAAVTAWDRRKCCDDDFDSGSDSLAVRNAAPHHPSRWVTAGGSDFVGGWSVMVLALSFCVLGLFWGAVAAVGVVALAGGASYVYRYATFSRDRSLPNE